MDHISNSTALALLNNFTDDFFKANSPKFSGELCVMPYLENESPELQRRQDQFLAIFEKCKAEPLKAGGVEITGVLSEAGVPMLNKCIFLDVPVVDSETRAKYNLAISTQRTASIARKAAIAR